MKAVTDFFAMGGYALYVWGSVVMCALALGGELLALRRRQRALHTELAERTDTPANAPRQPVLTQKDATP